MQSDDVISRPRHVDATAWYVVRTLSKHVQSYGLEEVIGFEDEAFVRLTCHSQGLQKGNVRVQSEDTGLILRYPV